MEFDKNNQIAAIGTIAFHTAIFLFLLFTVLKSVVPEEEEGILVNFGNIDMAAGVFEPRGTGTPTPEQVSIPENTSPTPTRTTQEEMITQNTEETIALTERQRAEERRREEQRREQERQAEAERRRQAEEQRRQQAISDQVAGAFGSGNTDGSQGDAATGTGNQGNPFGNSDTGPTHGVGGIGSFNLNGRSIRGGGLPSPAYTSQIEGRIVVDITVNPKGDVISASVGKGTNIDDSSLRSGAIEAAKRAKFNSIQGTNNQSGTITYRYSLR